VEVADGSDDDEDEDMDIALPKEGATIIEEQLPTSSIGVQLLVNFSKLSIDHPESAASQAEEAHELLLIE
jgi:hypothetical protein